MSFNGLKAQLEILGYTVHLNESHKSVIVENAEHQRVASIGGTIVGEVATSFTGTHDMSDDERINVMRNIFEYAQTPIEDRFPAKKYYVKYVDIEGVEPPYERYVTYKRETDEYKIGHGINLPLSQAKFTVEETSNMPRSIREAIAKGVLEIVKASDFDF